MSRDEVLEKFKLRIEQGKSIRYSDIKKDDKLLLFAIEKIGGVSGCAEALGISKQELVDKYGLGRVILGGNLSIDEIERRLLYLKSIGRLKTIAMRTEFNDLRLENSLKRLYGSVNKGLEHFGLERDGVRLSKEGLIKEIRELSSKGIDMSYTNILKINSKLLYNSTNKFNKGWYTILKENNIPYIAIRKEFNRQSIKERLSNVQQKSGGEINYALIRKYDVSILNYVWENYESIYDFFMDFGFNADECVDMNTQKSKGFAFEKLFKEVLDLLKIDYKYNKFYNKDMRPDFQLDNSIWIDCKLSSWTSSIPSTIEKYTTECNKLIIIFLRGEEYHLDHLTHEKVEFRKVDYYYPFLRQIKRHDLIEEFEKIQYENTVSVTTERSIS